MNKSSLKQKYLLFKVRQQKDAEAYGQLYDHFVDRIFRFILFKVSSVEEAEDLTSEVFLKTWEYINNSKKKIQNLNALLYRVARNSVIDYYRTRKEEDKSTDQEHLLRIKDERDVEGDINLKMEIKNIEKHLAKLKDVYREIIILKYVEDFSITEIAEIIDKRKGNVRVLLHRALKALKEIAED